MARCNLRGKLNDGASSVELDGGLGKNSRSEERGVSESSVSIEDAVEVDETEVSDESDEDVEVNDESEDTEAGEDTTEEGSKATEESGGAGVESRRGFCGGSSNVLFGRGPNKTCCSGVR